ncbi:MAG: sulfide/dihydroorotate dehydrogenase-like FAD/NAD-binding protein [Bacteroidia bacterium]|nr:sulfide/dihydroorotate dehydrogenase-like FAD/NAD-binding protein [Bacteroidia bacterium]
MFEIIERKMIVPNLHLLVVHAPDIVDEIQPGQFVIIHAGEGSERIPLSAADWNHEDGTLTIVFMEVGTSTGKLAMLKPGDFIPTVVGPLGKPTEIENFGTVVCIGGCFGIASIFPTVKALKEKGNTVITIVEGRSKNLLYWEKKLADYSDKLINITRDGSYGYKGHVNKAEDIIRETGIKPDRIIANGCMTLSYKTTQEYSHYNVPVMVMLNTIMIDGTGMCGVCRCTVDGRMRFACVDGPEFDGRLVDWEELAKRRKQYVGEEAFLVHHSGCGGI